MNHPPALTHEAILASAGSGKTHALVTRYLQLLARGEAPERIIALTFTRKAAGEFFDKILQRLAGAAVDEAARARLAADVGRAGLEREEVVAWLRRMIEALPRLTLGTLDSFFIRMVSAFALEFGLGGPFTLLEGDDIARAREELCRGLFQGMPADRRGEQDDFIEAFQLATYGVEEKSLHRAFDSFVEAHHHAWMQDPVPEKWGRPTAVWPQLPWYLQTTAGDPQALRETFAAALEVTTLSDAQKRKLLDVATKLSAHVPGTETSKTHSYLQSNILPSLDGLRRGRAQFKVQKMLTLEGAACEALTALIGRLLAGEADVVLRRTRGLAALLGDYESQHEAGVRREGRLTFDDVKFLLARGGPGGDGLARLAVDARLDARYDHWLIDEFQDTSLLQWEVLRPLVEEVLEDPEGRRTYFQVGDEKQSIYRWRGGEPALGRHIIERYQLPTRPLTESRRSAPPVMDLVNAVFGDAGAMRSVVPPATAARWEAGWVAHTTFHRTRPGFAALVRPGAMVRGDEGAADEGAADEGAAEMGGDALSGGRDREAEGGAGFDGELEVVAAVLREILPLERGLSVAILLRGNTEVADAVAFLRRQADLPPVVSETDAPVAVDNPLTLALLSLLRVAAHPGDTMAWEHVMMTPLAGVWAPEEATRGRLVRQTLQEVWSDGLEAWVRRWLERLEPVLAADDAFSRLRGEQLADLAREFDAGGSRDLDAFLRAAETSVARERAWSDAVQVMTIHKSKGLDFDVVFLPRLAGKSLADDSRQLLLRSRGDDFETRWVLRRPPSILVAADDVLREAREADQAAQAYEGLCVLYVAMTRARHAVYLIGAEKAGAGSARHAAMLVEQALGGQEPADPLVADGREWACGWSAGDPRWFEAMPVGGGSGAAAVSPAAAAVFVPSGPGRRRRPRLTPSGRETHVLTADQVFSAGATPARELGVLVHALFERIDDPDDPSGAESWWSSTHPEPADWQREAWQQVTACLDDPDLRVLMRRSPDAGLWREKRFEVILDGEWVTGTFDRVMVGPDRAVIVDFKTDQVADEAAARDRAAGYRPQLDLYRRVLARLTGLDPAAIRTVLVFTRLRRAVEVADA